MKRFALATLIFVLGIAATSQAMPKKLPSGEARQQAQIAMQVFTQNHKDVDSLTVKRCARKSRIRFRCTGTARGEDDRSWYRCDLTVAVRYRYLGGDWKTQAKLTRNSCKRTAKPYLSDRRAEIAMFEEGMKASGGWLPRIDSTVRISNTEITGEVQWGETVGKSGYGICKLPVTVKLVRDELVTTSGSRTCQVIRDS